MPSSLDITELYELESLYTESRHLLDTSAVPAGSNDVCSMHKTVTSTSDADVQSLDDDEASPSSAQPGQLLKKTISLGLAIAIVVFAINLVVLIWAYARSRSFDGSCIFYTGSCATSRHISLVISVFINLLSTLLLAASNNAGQYISSPTRENIDKAHSSGRWLYIGSFSFRNLRYIGWRRTLLWLGFMCSSVPLHLFWNAVVVEISSTNAYAGFIVTEDFLNPSSYFNQTLQTVGPGQLAGNLASVMKAKAPELTVLDTAQCLQAYDTAFQSAWSNLLVVVDANASSPNWLNTITYQPGIPGPGVSKLGVSGPRPGWLCGVWEGFYHLEMSVEDNPCEVGALLEDASHWKLPITICENFSADGLCLGTKRQVTLPVLSCLAEPAAEHCSLEVLPEFLLIVIVCNAIKIVLFSIVLRLQNFHPVAIIGDAISSFLESSDSTTSCFGPITVENARKHGIRRLLHGITGVEKFPWKSTRKRWGRAVKISHWVCLDFLFVSFLSLVSFFVLVANFPRVSTQQEGFGLTVSSENFTGTNLGIIPSTLYSNLGQLLATALYLSINSFLTRMLAADELHAFSTTNGRKPLRTTDPLRGQRTRFFLHIPLRYAIPMMASMFVLHFFVSQAAIAVRMNVYDFEGNYSAPDSFAALFSSFNGAISATVWALVLVLILHGMAFRRLRTENMPLMAGNSLAISAACHPPKSDTDAATKPVAYGAFYDMDNSTTRAGFTSYNVRKLQEGVQY